MIFLPHMGKEGPPGKKIKLCLKWFKGAQMGPKKVLNGQQHLG